MKKQSPLRILVLSTMLALVCGIALAGPDSDDQKQNKLNENYDLIKAPTGPEQQLQQIAPGGGQRGKSGHVKHLPLDNLKAEKFKTDDGKTGWKVKIPGNRALATPAVVDGMVYVGGGFGSYEFYAFDADTGRPRWAIKVSDDGPTAAVVSDGVVAFNTESCTLFVVDAKSGRMLWSQWLGDPLMSQPAIADGMVFMAYPASRTHQLIALGLKDGKEKWKMPIEGDIISAPVVYEDSVYVTTFDGNVYRFRMNDGKEVWKKDFKATSAPWLYKDQVYVSQRKEGEKRPEEGLLRLDNRKGKQNQESGAWRNRPAPYLDSEVQKKSRYYSAQKEDDSSVGFSSAPATAKVGAAEANVGQSTVRGLWEFQGSRPVIVSGRLFMTQGDEVVALDPDDGDELWTHDISGDLEKVGGHLAAPPSPAGGTLYLATVTGKVLVLSQRNGKVKDMIDVGSQMRFQPALSGGRLFAGTTDGVLVSIDLDDRSADGWSMWGGGPGHNGN